MHKYILEPYQGKQTRYTCPKCKSKYQFTRYIDTEESSYIDENVGICNRIDKCGYHLSPSKYFESQRKLNLNSKSKVKKDEKRQIKTIEVEKGRKMTKKPTNFIPKEVFNNLIDQKEEDNLSRYLKQFFTEKQLTQVKDKYKIGLSNKWGGNTTIFWQIDEKDRIRTGKLIKYNPITGKRIKKPFIHTNWVHSTLNKKDYNLKQCFFGAHLVKKESNNIIAIVESEKTALIMSIKVPDMIWLASGGAEGINDEKVTILDEKRVILYPDLSKNGKIHEKWLKIADKYNFEISNLLEEISTESERCEGLDLADYVLNGINSQNDIKENDCNNINDYNYILNRKKELESNKNPTKISNNNQLLEVITTEFDQVPYFSPSKAYEIDQKLELVPESIMIKHSEFKDKEGNEIKIIGTYDLGRCKSSGHKWEGKCPYCIYNCVHILKVNGKLVKRAYSNKEILLLQDGCITISD